MLESSTVQASPPPPSTTSHLATARKHSAERRVRGNHGPTASRAIACFPSLLFFYPFLLPRGGEMNQVEGASGCESIHRDAACLPGKRNAAKIDNEVVSFRRPQQPEHCFFFPPFFPLHTHLRLIADAGPA